MIALFLFSRVVMNLLFSPYYHGEVIGASIAAGLLLLLFGASGICYLFLTSGSARSSKHHCSMITR